MSRSGYSEDCDNLNLYRGNVGRVLSSKRGQAFLLELAAALDAMPNKALIAGELINTEGACCTLGVICKTRKIDTNRIDYEDPDSVGSALGINHIMAAEIAFMNDEYAPTNETPEKRWQRMRDWVSDQIKTLINA